MSTQIVNDQNKLQFQSKYISNSNNTLNDITRTPIKSILKKTNNSLNSSWLQIKQNLENNNFKDSNNRYSSLADMYLDLTLNNNKTPEKNHSMCVLNFPDILETSFKHNIINDPSTTLIDPFYEHFDKSEDVISLNVDFSNDEEFEANYEKPNTETFKFEMDPKKFTLELSFSSTSSSSKSSHRSSSPMTEVSSTSSITYYDDFYISNKLSRNFPNKNCNNLKKNIPVSKSATCLTKTSLVEDYNISNSLSSISSLTSSSLEKKSNYKTEKKELKNIKNDVRIYENMCMFSEFNRKLKYREEQKMARRDQFLKNTKIVLKKESDDHNINLLDDFLLIYIFSKLNTIEKLMLQFVCKRWHKIIWSTEYTYKLFKTIEITNDSVVLFKPIQKNEPVGKNFTFKFFRKKPQKLAQTKSLNIQTGNKVLNIDSVLKFLLTKLVNRQTYPLCLCVEKIRIKNTNRLTDRGLELIANLCPELRHLSIRNCLCIKSNSIEKIIENCENLKFLDLTGCFNLNNLIIRINSRNVNEEKVKVNGSLNLLYKKFIGNSKKCEEIPTDIKENLKSDQFNVAQYLYLQFIDLSFCSNITDKSLESLCKTCIYIKNLYLRRCRQVTDIGILYIAKYCVNLRELSLCQCVKVTDTGIKYLANDKILYSSSKNSINENEKSQVLIKNKDFKYKIRYLSLAECPLITDYSLIYLCKLGFFQQIKYLNLRGCTKITDKFTKYLVGSSMIFRLIQSRPERISLSKIKSKHLIPFDLKSVDFSKCSITDKTIEYLCRLTTIKPSNLQRLSLRYCDGITDEGVKRLALNCKNLQSLNLTKCNKVTSQSLKEIKKNCPSCVIQHTNFSFC